MVTFENSDDLPCSGKIDIHVIAYRLTIIIIILNLLHFPTLQSVCTMEGSTISTTHFLPPMAATNGEKIHNILIL